MANLYEIMTVIAPSENDDDVIGIIGGLRQQVTTSGGEILAVDIWGRRRLAYPIRKFEEGTYVLMHVEGAENLPGEFRAHTKIRESILREMVVRLEDEHEAAVRKELEEKGPEDEALAAEQLAAAQQRAAEKRARIVGEDVAAAVITTAHEPAGAPAEDAVAAEAASEDAAPAEDDAPAQDAAPAESATADDDAASDDAPVESDAGESDEAPDADVDKEV